MMKLAQVSYEPLTKKPKINSLKQVLTHVSKSNMSKNTRRVTIPVTDLASLCGMDHYNNWSKSICKLWKQVYPDNYKQACDFVNSKNMACVTDSTYMKIKKLESRTGTDKVISKQVWQINNIKDKSTTNLRTRQTTVEQDINTCSVMTEKDKQEMITLMNSATNVVYGTRNENIGMNEFVTRSGKQIKTTQTSMYHHIANNVLVNGDKIEWVITGKYDGLTVDNELVEVKNRQKCLFNTIRDYENCQLQVYLNILGLDIAYLVEVIHNNNKPDVNILQTRKDETYMDLYIFSYLNEIRSFVLDIPYMLESDRYKLLSGERRSL